MTTKAQGDSVRQRLVALSAKLGAAYPNVETAFLIERLVVRLLTDKKLSQRLVFKGGFVGLRVYDSGRYTVDLDALLMKADIESTLTLAKEKAEEDLDDGVWFRFESQVDLDTQGEHWVTDHPLWVPPTEKRPGYHTTRDGHCATNPMRGKVKIVKDYLTAEEMQMMADKNFSNLSGPPASGKLPEYVVGADNFDQFIRGWTKYWNDIFKPDEPLDPDLIKALIATESGFRLKPPAPDAGVAGMAHGLIQLTDQAIKALGDPSGELLNHLVKISTENTSDPNLSIGAAVRWLFRKRDLASHRLKRQATWREGIAEYKAYLKDMVSGKDPNPVQMQKLDDIYGRLKK